MSELVEFAERMLETHGEFHPFGGYLDGQQKVVHVGLSSERDWTSARHRAEALAGSLGTVARESHPFVVGIVTNVTMPDHGGHTDAIRVFLEHRDSYCADVFFYYRFSEGHLRMGPVTAQQGVPSLFQRVD